MPNELQFALSVNVSDMRPWEFWESDSAELYMITTILSAYQEGQADAKDQIEAAERNKASAQV
jgi:hypothetical protein